MTIRNVSLFTLLLLVVMISLGSAAEDSFCPREQVQPVTGGWAVLTWIPSEAAPDKGIVVQLIYPETPRYPAGAPAVVAVPGADTTGSVTLRKGPIDPWIEQGLVRVLFAFPGGGDGATRSGGTYDHRGLASLAAVRDVVRFLRGELPDHNGCTITDLIPYPIIQVGLVGSSNGGNTAVVAMGLFGKKMEVDWYVGWENPAGVQFTTVDIGSRNKPNPAYIPGSCRLTADGAVCDVDYSNLRWDPSASPMGWGPQRSWEKGVLYFDLNGNGTYDDADYTLGAYIGEFAGMEKRVYSTAVLEAAVARGLIDPWPEDVATLDEARSYWEIRDMSRYYARVLEQLPNLRAIVIGSVKDHVQATPDYPHIVLHYQGWQEAGIDWIRLNPDAAYVQAVFKRPADLVDNDADIQVTYSNILQLLEPEGAPDEFLRIAAAAELSDRVYTDDWRTNLDEPLSATGGEAALALPHSVLRLSNGHTLITDGSAGPPDRRGLGPRGGKIVEMDAAGKTIWEYSDGIDFPHHAELSPDGKRVLIADTGNNRVIEVEIATGRVLWDTRHIQLSDGSHLNYPNDANYLPDGDFLITDRNNHRVLVIDRSGQVKWQFGKTSVPGNDGAHLRTPHNADLLPNGDVIIADSNNNRILEVSPAGKVVWEYCPQGARALNWPRDADRLANGNTLITDSKNGRVIEVTPEGDVVWEFRDLRMPYEADRLSNGNTLISDSGNHRVIEVDPLGKIVWVYPFNPS